MNILRSLYALMVVLIGIGMLSPDSALSQTMLTTQSYNQPNGIPQLNADGAITSPVSGDVTNALVGGSTLGVLTNSYLTKSLVNAAGGVAGLDGNSNITGDITPLYATTQRVLSAKLGDSLNAKDFGALCDGTTDDTAAIQAGLNAVATSDSRELIIPGGNCVVSANIVVPTATTIRGTNWKGSILLAGTYSGNLLTLSSGSAVRDLSIVYSSNPTGGDAIDAATNLPMHAVVENVYMFNPYIGIDLSGNSISVRNSRLDNPILGVRVGYTTTKGNTVDPRVTDTTIQTAAGGVGMAVYDAGGLYLTNNDVLYGYHGMMVIPGANQMVTWMFASNTVLSDTASLDAVYMQPSDSTAQIKSISMVGSWISNSQARGLVITNPLGAEIQNINLESMRFYTNNQNSVDITNATHIRLVDSEFCGGGNTATDAYFNTNVTNVIVMGNDFTGVCGGVGIGSPYAITFVSGNDKLIVQGNDFSGLSAAINMGTNGSTISTQISGNLE